MTSMTLAREDWDFRSIEDWELLTAIVYEYTRSCGRLLEIIQKWHSEPFAVDSLEEYEWDEPTWRIYNVLKRQEKPLTNANAIQIAHDILDPNIARASDLTLFQMEMRRTLKPRLANIKVSKADRIATRFEDLSAPWTILREQYGESYLRKRCLSFQARSRSVYNAWPSSVQNELMASTPSLRKMDILIDWRQTKEDLITDFIEWLDENRPEMPREHRRKPGPKARWAWLKWLAAFRISQSKLKFAEAKEYVKVHAAPQPLNASIGDVLPNYQHQAAWDNAVRKAQAALSGDFAKAILADFGLLL
jgi:hypothetical protein